MWVDLTVSPRNWSMIIVSESCHAIMYYHSLCITLEFVEFLIIVWIFHCPQTTALSKAFLSYIIALYWVASFVVVRHHQLGLDYWAAIFVSARLYCALQIWRRTLSWNTSWWCVRGWKQETGYFSWRMRSLTFPIYVWPFGPSLWIISKNDMANRSCANSLQFRVHILRHNYNRLWARPSATPSSHQHLSHHDRAFLTSFLSSFNWSQLLRFLVFSFCFLYLIQVYF